MFSHRQDICGPCSCNGGEIPAVVCHDEPYCLKGAHTHAEDLAERIHDGTESLRELLTILKSLTLKGAAS